jgi:hypothetical protein
VVVASFTQSMDKLKGMGLTCSVRNKGREEEIKYVMEFTNYHRMVI